MKTVYILSASRLKIDGLIGDNVSDDMILPVIQNSQDIELQDLIGSKLLGKIYDLISTGSINKPEFVSYKELIDNYIVPYLVMLCTGNLIIPLQYKFRNAGLVNTVDQQTANADLTVTKFTTEYYRNKANSYAIRLKDYLCDNASRYPEYKKTDELGYKISIVL